MNTVGVVMPRNRFFHYLTVKWLTFLHNRTNCIPFFIVKKNKNKKDYLRECRVCSCKQQKINGKWSDIK